MSNTDRPNNDTRPAYVSPRAIRLDDVSTGIGAGCGQGSSPTGGNCLPTGNGATIGGCRSGNGAKPTCTSGQGVA